MENLKITLELTLEEVRFVVNELWQFRTAKEEANKQQPEPQPFQLEYGKRYKRRDGKITDPLVVNDSYCKETHPFKCPYSKITWKPNGIWGFGTQTDELDLIEEA
jgi:hypothetical protein